MAVLQFTAPRPDPLDRRALRRELRDGPAVLAAAGVNLVDSADGPPGQVLVTVYHPADVDPAAVEEAVRAVLEAHAAGQVVVGEDRAAFTVTAAQAARAREVWRGEATFTDPQAQKILAGVLLDWLRRQS